MKQIHVEANDKKKLYQRKRTTAKYAVQRSAFRVHKTRSIPNDIIFIRLSFYLCISVSIVSLHVLTSSSVISLALQNFMLFLPFQTGCVRASERASKSVSECDVLCCVVLEIQLSSVDVIYPSLLSVRWRFETLMPVVTLPPQLHYFISLPSP